MFKNPEELKYTKTHEWVKEEDGYCVVGLTDYAQDALGDIVFVNVPSVDDLLGMVTEVKPSQKRKAEPRMVVTLLGISTEANEEHFQKARE